MRLMLACFRAAHDQLAPQKLLVVQLLHCALRFVDRLHLHECESFRTLVMPISYDLGVLYVADTVKQLE
jgi:hypothetical protein